MYVDVCVCVCMHGAYDPKAVSEGIDITTGLQEQGRKGRNITGQVGIIGLILKSSPLISYVETNKRIIKRS